MAFSKKARAGVVHPDLGATNWQNFVKQHGAQIYTPMYRTAAGSPNLVGQASDILEEQFDPKNYLLTHATIVASVDVDDMPNVKLGNVSELGRRINRKWADYRIKESCDKFINNNHDAWSRPVLLKSYRTFVGAHNFVEHVQIEEQSKGRIIDAVARDIGDSIYVDILVATNRKHAALVDQIKTGRMSTMSMGCTVTETICTKCGNVATDETDMCEHIKYAKGSFEYDELGRRFRVAELCGHDSLDPTGGVHFIEASWVATPAFPGAVLRSVVEPTGPAANIRTKRQIRNVMAAPAKEWHEDENLRAASIQTPTQWDTTDVSRMAFDFGDEGEAEESKSEDEDKDSLQQIEDQLVDYVSNRVKSRVKEKMQQKQQEEAAYKGEMATSKNENINKQAAAYRVIVAGLVETARNDADLMDRLAAYEQKNNIKVSTDLYRTALRVGSTAKYGSVGRYLVHCGKVLGHQPTKDEAKTLVRLGRILSMRK